MVLCTRIALYYGDTYIVILNALQGSVNIQLSVQYT